MKPHYGSYADLTDAPYVVDHIPTIGYVNPDNHPIPELAIHRMRTRLKNRMERIKIKRISNLKQQLLTPKGQRLCKRVGNTIL